MFKDENDNVIDTLDPQCNLFGFGWDRMACRNCRLENSEQWETCRQFTMIQPDRKKNIRSKRQCKFFEEDI